MNLTDTISSPVSNAEKNERSAFEKLYLQVRYLEDRIYTDKEVAALPNIHPGHIHQKEWQIRKHSSEQLLKYLIKKNKPLEILETGCGNGWLSAWLSSILASHVTGIDVNIEELNQAKRVFNKNRNLEFISCSLQNESLSKRKFDIIIFAASIQYFSPLEHILEISFRHLKPGGEIHIIDSPFYKQNEPEAAMQRSKDYYASIGFAEMADHYFHHSIEELKPFNYKILHNPHSIFNNLKKHKNPFYWVSISNNA